MSLRNILVAYNGSPSSDAALAAGLFMQGRYQAHITGLMAMRSRLDLKGQPWLPQSVRDNILAHDRAHVHEVETRFRAQTDGAEAAKTHWIAKRADADATVLEYAQMYDLTVVGRRDTVLSDERALFHPDKIALKSGRPVLVVPQGWSPEAFTDHAVLAWDGNRAATRALADAMPLLERKRKVTVLSIDTGRQPEALEGISVETVLERHGISHASVTLPAAGRNVAGIMLDFCTEAQAGLLVMGAYEHSKFREDMFGGVTNSVLENTQIPILMSH